MVKIQPEMLISEVLAVCPEAADVLEKHGLGCAGCLAASMETLSSVAHVHEVSLDALTVELNAVAGEGRADGKESGL